MLLLGCDEEPATPLVQDFPIGWWLVSRRCQYRNCREARPGSKGSGLSAGSARRQDPVVGTGKPCCP